MRLHVNVVSPGKRTAPGAGLNGMGCTGGSSYQGVREHADTRQIAAAAMIERAAAVLSCRYGAGAGIRTLSRVDILIIACCWNLKDEACMCPTGYRTRLILPMAFSRIWAARIDVTLA